MFQDTKEGRIKIASMFAGCFGTLASIHDYKGNSRLETFLHSYGQDVCLPFAIYSALRFVGLKQGFTLGYSIIGLTALEIADLITPNQTFDPNDFLAYTTGLGLAFLIDRYSQQKKPQKTITQISFP
jgi:hypothetical protein